MKLLFEHCCFPLSGLRFPPTDHWLLITVD